LRQPVAPLLRTAAVPWELVLVLVLELVLVLVLALVLVV
jgi:hypothetical protein